jgi:ribosome biogenesis GTPase / thiamine phosphate phosphatase
MDHGTGSVVVNFGTQALVDTGQGELLRCSIRGKRLRAVCGDIVRWERIDAATGAISGIEKREHALERSDGRGGRQPVASALDRVLVVVAPEPEPDPVLIDRYLVMTELGGLEGALLLNKMDLASPEFAHQFDEFVQAGYPLLSCSAVTGTGVPSLRDAVGGFTTILVGQSGVGKSSLLNTLVADLELQTGVLSGATGEGRHTTTATTRYLLPGGGALVDSPGVREFWLPKMPATELVTGFREIERLAADCRFRNCVHADEPDCAVQRAVEQGGISSRRYRSYRQLLRTVCT